VSEVIGHLKAKPDRGRAAEVAGEAERSFRRDPSPAPDDLADAQSRQTQCQGQRVGAKRAPPARLLVSRRCGSGQRPRSGDFHLASLLSDSPRSSIGTNSGDWIPVANEDHALLVAFGARRCLGKPIGSPFSLQWERKDG
jgi:hypothetical protein